jgi:hypothetical protein
MQVALEFDVHIVAAEDANEAVDDTPCLGGPTFLECGSERTFVATGQANEPGSVLLEFVLEDGTFFFSLRTQLHASDELAEILVSGAGRNEERKFEFTTETRRHGGRAEFLILGCRSKIG